LGFGVANPALLKGLIKVKDSYNVDAIANAVGAAAIADQTHKNTNANKIKASRTHMANALKQLGFQVWSSEANFLLVSVSSTASEELGELPPREAPPLGNAESLYQTLKQRGILVRYFNQPRLADKLRITIGTPEQNETLIKNLDEVLNLSKQSYLRPPS
jgi:histidinol-phosphate aminotransferase